ncbi:hypothetical protein FB595_101339 [Sphingobium sp. AEW010]|nr:hypothetical protein [Sphingobium sp. JAI105]TWD12779.1 hypothetical protein FB595_101339 [Sphingobium sp. AEW010]TWD30550.1 hypothetical protein FB596_101339 [Sphingobium sp. AEW013]TWD30695.1 hypothetical protein FB594_10176 [Sphingobium sp. AEW001]
MMHLIRVPVQAGTQSQGLNWIPASAGTRRSVNAGGAK